MCRPLSLAALAATFSLSLAVHAAPPRLSRALPGGPSPQLPEGATSDWWMDVQRSMQREEYAVGPGTDGRLTASNRAHRFEVSFERAGFRLSGATGSDPSFTWGLSLVRWGRPGALSATSPATPQAGKERVEYPRAGLVEWMKNDASGLEHGFDVPAPPAATGGPLLIDLRLEGSLRPVLDEDGQAVDLYSSRSVSVLRYAKLKVTDAHGNVLASRFRAFPGGIRIEVEDRGAVYPIVVDPLASVAWEASGDEDDAFFGASVRAAGDVNNDGYSDVVVAAPYHSGGGVNRGRAYLYLGSAAGLGLSPVWTASGDEDFADLGYSVGSAGDVNGDGYSDVIVAAPYHNGGGSNRGRTYVYRGSWSGLEALPAWTISGDEDGALLGTSVGTAGDVDGDGYSDVIVGAPGHDAGAGALADRGRAYIYHGSAAGLPGLPRWTLSETANGALLGSAVSTAGDVNGDGLSDVIVGAPEHDAGSGAGARRGRAHVYLGWPGGMNLARTITGDEDLAELGAAVGTAGDVNGDGYADVVVGARGHDGGAGAGADRGRAYLYLGSAWGTVAAPAWTVTGDEDGASYGASLGPAGDVDGDGYADVVVGVPYKDDGPGTTDRGRAYVYFGSASGPGTTPAWSSGGFQDFEFFGFSVFTAGDVNGDGYSDLVLSSPGHDGGGGVGASRGRAVVFLGSAAEPAGVAGWTISGGEDLAYLGSSVASAGDVNGDGYSDVIVGAYGDDAGSGAGADRGRADLHLGSAAGIAASAAWTAYGDEDGAWFGAAVGTAGDVNGDGYDDVIVGAYLHDAGGAPGADRGRAYVYLGSPAGPAATPIWTGSGDEIGSGYGAAVGTAGDVNGDGRSDVAIGAFGHDAGAGAGAERGRAYVHLGSPSGVTASPAWTASGDENDAFFGTSLGTAGDVDGDGYSDVVVGAYRHDAGGGAGANRGRAYVYLGSASGLGSIPAWTASGDQNDGRFGSSVGTAGDVNGDGYADVILGAYAHDTGGTDEGAVYIHFGSPSGLAAGATWWYLATEDFAYLGSSVSTAGDVNGDGYSDVIVGTPYNDPPGLDRGNAYIWHGSATGPGYYGIWGTAGDEDDARLGGAVAAAGDVNGDGYADVIVGASGHDAGGSAGAERGRAYVYDGNGGAGVPLRPRQFRSDLSAPISPLGAAHQQAFRLGVTLRSPVGRTQARLQWQLAKLGQTFRPTLNPVRTDGTWWDVTGSGPARTVPIALPEQPIQYAWRIRVAYHPASSPFQPHGPWVTVAANGLREADLLSTAQAPPPPCTAPDEAVLIAAVTLNPQAMPVLHVQDGNQPSDVTGYNVYRATAPAGPYTLVASDVVDMDSGTPDVQWVDQNGATGGPYYYGVRAYNHVCPAEGP